MDLGAFVNQCQRISQSLVTTDSEIIQGRLRDWTGRFSGTASALVRPSNQTELELVMELAQKYHVPLQAQGGNTSLVGGATPMGDSAILATDHLDTIGPFDSSSHAITVGAGVTLAKLNQELEPSGFRFGVDLASRASATLGAMLATNAGGIHVIGYGPMRNQVLGLSVVTPAFSTISRLDALYKDNSGLDLVSIFSGSEGTLGIVSELVLRAVAIPKHRAVALLGFADFATAELFARTLRQNRVLSALEVMFDNGMALVENYLSRNVPFRAKVYLLAEYESQYSLTEHLMDIFSSVAETLNAWAIEPAQCAQLWSWREAHTEAIARAGIAHKLDVALPLDRLAEFVSWIDAEFSPAYPGTSTVLFGHLGDGNIHVNILGLEPQDFECDEVILSKAASLGGSISAEHGIGRAKVGFLNLTRSAADMAAMLAIKNAFDPDHILNPGVLFA